MFSVQANSDEDFMQLALKEAVKAFDQEEVPIGCIVVHQGKVIAKAHNQVERLGDATAHAEMLAITQASEALGSWRLSETKIYTTLEPCPMCAGAIQLARIPHLIYGAKDPKKGACGSLINVLSDTRFNHTAAITSGICEEDCASLLSEFFQSLRKK